MKTESIVLQEIRMDAPFHHCTLMRNNSGAFEDKQGRFVRYGLMNESKKQNEEIKSSDLIGPTTIVVTPDMVGKHIAVLTVVEVKEEGWVFNPKDKREQAQLKFINWIKSAGGFAGFASSVEDFRKIIGR
jgi:hypothetical protein